jgi:acyl-CoA dehydrogenase
VVPEYLNGRAYTIFGGTSEIQRDIIAKMMLGI